MNFQQRLHEALGGSNPKLLLRALMRELLDQGYSREQLVAELELLRTTLQEEQRDQDEDLVLDIMDYLTGWCSPHMEL